jgi:hypothetical protein
MRATSLIATATAVLVATPILVALLAAPAAAQDASALYALNDPTGDADPYISSEALDVPDGAHPQSDPIDMTAFRIVEEDLTSLHFQIDVVDSLPPTSNADLLDRYYFKVRFQVEGNELIYEVYSEFYAPGALHAAETEPPEAFGTVDLCVRTPDTPDEWYYCSWQAAYGNWNLTEDRLDFIVPKHSILGKNPATRYGSVIVSGADPLAGLPKRLNEGTKLTNIVVTADREMSLFFGEPFLGLRDTIPNGGQAGQPYALTRPTANVDIVLGLGGQGEGTGPSQGSVSIESGGGTVVPIKVTNRQDGKRLVNLTATVVDGPITAKVAPAVEVPGDDARAVNLVVNATGSMGHGATGIVEIVGKSLGREDEVGLMRLLVRATVPPSPQNNVLRFHAYEYSDADIDIEGFTICITGCSFQSGRWLNTLENDPNANMDAEGYSAIFPMIGPLSPYFWIDGYALDAPLPQDILFEDGKPVHVRLTYASRVPMQVDATVTLSAQVPSEGECNTNACYETVYLGSGQASQSVGSSATTFDISFVVDPEARRVKAPGSILSVQIQLSTPEWPQTWANWLDGFTFLPAQSSLTLPLIPVPPPQKTDAQGLAVHAIGSGEDYVNPGRARAFHVVVVNEGLEPRHVTVEAQPANDGWGARVEPANRYALDPGASVNLTVLVAAPEQAAEGERARVNVTARTTDAESGGATASLFAIATRGIDIPDESENYTVDDDAAAKAVRDEGGSSPGIGLVIPLAVLVGVGGWARRRQHEKSSTLFK